MSYHILHLLSPNLRIRLELDQIRIKDRETGTERSVPLADVAVIVAATPDLQVTAGSKYRMAWVLVFFDLPVGTAEERKAAGNFRRDLIKDGYFMAQYSVYARPCGSADRVETQVRRLRGKIPAKGEVRRLIISDAQWGRMIVVRSKRETPPEEMPQQLLFF